MVPTTLRAVQLEQGGLDRRELTLCILSFNDTRWVADHASAGRYVPCYDRGSTNYRVRADHHTRHYLGRAAYLTSAADNHWAAWTFIDLLQPRRESDDVWSDHAVLFDIRICGKTTEALN